MRHRKTKPVVLSTVATTRFWAEEIKTLDELAAEQNTSRARLIREAVRQTYGTQQAIHEQPA